MANLLNSKHEELQFFYHLGDPFVPYGQAEFVKNLKQYMYIKIK